MQPASNAAEASFERSIASISEVRDSKPARPVPKWRWNILLVLICRSMSSR